MKSLGVNRNRDGELLVETSAPVVWTCLSVDRLVPWQGCSPGELDIGWVKEQIRSCCCYGHHS